MGLDGECADAVAPEDVYGGSRDEVRFCIQWDCFSTEAFVGNAAVEGVVGRGLAGDCEGDFKVDVEGETDDIKTGADVGGRAGHSDDRGHFEGRLAVLCQLRAEAASDAGFSIGTKN